MMFSWLTDSLNPLTAILGTAALGSFSLAMWYQVENSQLHRELGKYQAVDVIKDGKINEAVELSKLNEESLRAIIQRLTVERDDSDAKALIFAKAFVQIDHIIEDLKQ